MHTVQLPKIETADIQTAMPGVMRCPDFIWDDVHNGDWTNYTFENYLEELKKIHGDNFDEEIASDNYYPDEENYFIDDNTYTMEIIYLGGAPLLYIHKSPFMTRALKCSPCVPHANDLDSLDPDGFDTYCLSEQDMQEREI